MGEARKYNFGIAAFVFVLFLIVSAVVVSLVSIFLIAPLIMIGVFMPLPYSVPVVIVYGILAYFFTTDYIKPYVMAYMNG